MTEQLRVKAVAASALHDLRRRVLRNNDPAAPVADRRDDESTARHFGGYLGDRLVVSGSFYPSSFEENSEYVTHQLRYLAVDADLQGRGFGRILMRAAETRLCSEGVEQLWANGRDSALGFYDSTGWRRVPGSEHLSPETQLPHTVIYKVLRRDEPYSIGWANSLDGEMLARLREEMYFSTGLYEQPRDWLTGAATWFNERVTNGEGIIAVARTSAGEVIASAGADFRRSAPTPIYQSGWTAYIHTVSTLPGFRRRGISRQLVSALLTELIERGFDRIELHATAQGEHLYRDLGFSERGSLELRYRPGENVQ